MSDGGDDDSPTTPPADAVAAVARRLLAAHAREVRALLGPACPATLPGPPVGGEAALAFYRAHVSGSAPALIAAVTDGWVLKPGTAPLPWTRDDDFVRAAGAGARVLVASTPDGRADAVRAVDARSGRLARWARAASPPPAAATRLLFVQPAEGEMAVADLVAALRAEAAAVADGAAPPVVRYAQAQSGSLPRFGRLVDGAGIPAHLPWASALFQTGRPDAANAWVGGSASVSAWHRDPYDNVYVVLAGCKRFALLPPGEGGRRLRVSPFPAARWVEDERGGGFRAVPDSPPSTVPWSPAPPPPGWATPGAAAAGFDPPPDGWEGLYDGRGDAPGAPYFVTVPAGSALFLPAHWWHAVCQAPPPGQGACVAVNYWYDATYGPGFAGMALADRCAAVAAAAETGDAAAAAAFSADDDDGV